MSAAGLSNITGKIHRVTQSLPELGDSEGQFTPESIPLTFSFSVFISPQIFLGGSFGDVK